MSASDRETEAQAAKSKNRCAVCGEEIPCARQVGMISDSEHVQRGVLWSVDRLKAALRAVLTAGYQLEGVLQRRQLEPDVADVLSNTWRPAWAQAERLRAELG